MGWGGFTYFIGFDFCTHRRSHFLSVWRQHIPRNLTCSLLCWAGCSAWVHTLLINYPPGTGRQLFPRWFWGDSTDSLHSVCESKKKRAMQVCLWLWSVSRGKIVWMLKMAYLGKLSPPSHPNRLFRFILVSFRSCFVSFLFRFANYHKPFRTGFPAREASENGTRIHYWTNDGHYIFRHAIQKSLTQFTGSGCQAKTYQSKVLVDGVVGRDWCWFRIVYCCSFCQLCFCVLNLAEKRQTLFVPKITVIVAGIVIDLFCFMCRPKCCCWVAVLWFQFEGKTLAELHVCWY